MDGLLPRRNTRFFAFVSCSRSAAASQIFTLCPTCCTALARMTFASSFCYVNDMSTFQTDGLSNLRTCNLAASSQTSSLFWHCSQPCLISLRAATIRPACSSRAAAAIQPGACFGLDLMSESNNMRARLISPISASVLITWLSKEVRYPFGSMDVAEPDAVALPET